ncbi:MAG: hypothetical protein LBU85_02650 [Treponema sp.]|nr:hypothetical protein [Treponema sp.]
MFFLVSKGVSVYAQQLETTVATDFDNYIKQIISANEHIDLGIDDSDWHFYAIPIKSEKRELCNTVIKFLNSGETHMFRNGSVIWEVTYDKDNDRFILHMWTYM